MIVSCRTPLKNTLVMWVSWINIIINKYMYLQKWFKIDMIAIIANWDFQNAPKEMTQYSPYHQPRVVLQETPES